MLKSIIPLSFKIARDVDLTNNKNNVVVQIMNIKKLDKNNYLSLIPFNDNGYDNAIKSYECDICDVKCDHHNPIYTNVDHQGCDICSSCVEKVFTQQLLPIPGFRPGPIYSLKNIKELIKC